MAKNLLTSLILSKTSPPSLGTKVNLREKGTIIFCFQKCTWKREKQKSNLVRIKNNPIVQYLSLDLKVNGKKTHWELHHTETCPLTDLYMRKILTDLSCHIFSKRTCAILKRGSGSLLKKEFCKRRRRQHRKLFVSRSLHAQHVIRFMEDANTIRQIFLCLSTPGKFTPHNSAV